jgi:hypothetical protein
VERPLDNPWQIFDVIDPVHAFAKRPEDLKLIRILMKIHFLMRVPSVEVRRHIARDHHHRNRIQSGVRDTGGGIRQPRSKMCEQYTNLPGSARVSISGVSGDLFVPSRDKPDFAFTESVEERDDGVTTQTEYHFNADPLEILRQEVRRDTCGALINRPFCAGIRDDTHG